jgi:hypothetical protein
MAKEDLRTRRDSIFAKKFFTLVSNIESPGDVDDNPDEVALCAINFDEGTVNSSTDAEVLELSVNQVMDYRKLGTAIALLQRWQPQADRSYYYPPRRCRLTHRSFRFIATSGTARTLVLW